MFWNWWFIRQKFEQKISTNHRHTFCSVFSFLVVFTLASSITFHWRGKFLLSISLLCLMWLWSIVSSWCCEAHGVSWVIERVGGIRRIRLELNEKSVRAWAPDLIEVITRFSFPQPSPLWSNGFTDYNCAQYLAQYVSLS